MLGPFKSEHWHDANGNPGGGVSYGTGFAISWQNGPLGRGADRKEPNGAFVETLLAVVADRIRVYQQSFPCEENAAALAHIAIAMEALDQRTKDREVRGVEGTHQK